MSILARTIARPVMSRAAGRVQMQQKRTIVDGFENMKNDVARKQKHFQQNPHLHGADNPTYTKGTTDKMWNVAGGVVFFTVVASMLRGYTKIYSDDK